MDIGTEMNRQPVRLIWASMLVAIATAICASSARAQDENTADQTATQSQGMQGMAGMQATGDQGGMAGMTMK